MYISFNSKYYYKYDFLNIEFIKRLMMIFPCENKRAKPLGSLKFIEIGNTLSIYSKFMHKRLFSIYAVYTLSFILLGNFFGTNPCKTVNKSDPLTLYLSIT